MQGVISQMDPRLSGGISYHFPKSFMSLTRSFADWTLVQQDAMAPKVTMSISRW